MLKRDFLLFAMVAICAFALPKVAGANEGAETWYTTDSTGQPVVQLYFFWSRYCPHCLEARPFVDSLKSDYSWLRVQSLEVTENPQHAALYDRLAGSLGEEAQAVPAFLFCGEMHTGFDTPETTGATLRALLVACRGRLVSGTQGTPPKATRAAPLTLPVLGTIDPAKWSLPAFTIVIAALDAFNPCAFFVLLFLLSFMVHAQSRGRMLWVGGVFVTMSGIVYFVFMAAWLNVFLVAGQLRAITLAAGVVAMFVAILNIKDYFWFKRGASLSIPQKALPGIYDRARQLINARSLPVLTLGTMVLAIAANSYELLCTAGFPMVFTRILTLADLRSTSYYSYLALYNLVYVTPLATIVVIFALTLGTRKLTEAEGRLLKLLSGLMMLGLGTILLAAPQWLNHVFTALGLLAFAVATTALIAKLTAFRRQG